MVLECLQCLSQEVLKPQFSDTNPIGNGDEIEVLVRDGFIVRRADNAEM